MGSYLINFSIYTMAMVGVIFGALFLFKGVLNGNGFSKKTSALLVEDSMNLSARKKIYIINADSQRFLIAADTERTTLIAKLDKTDSENELCSKRTDKSSDLNSPDGITSLDEFASIIDFRRDKKSKGPMMRELAKKLSTM